MATDLPTVPNPAGDMNGVDALTSSRLAGGPPRARRVGEPVANRAAAAARANMPASWSYDQVVRPAVVVPRQLYRATGLAHPATAWPVGVPTAATSSGFPNTPAVAGPAAPTPRPDGIMAALSPAQIAVLASLASVKASGRTGGEA